MSERETGTYDGVGGGDHNQEYRMGNPGALLNWHQRVKLELKVNPRDVERRRNQEHNKRPEIQKAIDKAKAQLKRKDR